MIFVASGWFPKATRHRARYSSMPCQSLFEGLASASAFSIVNAPVYPAPDVQLAAAAASEGSWAQATPDASSTPATRATRTTLVIWSSCRR